MRCSKRDKRLWISVNFTGVKNSKSIPTKSLIDRCENAINFEVVSKNTIKRDSSFNVNRQRKISFEDRVVVEGSKLTYGAGPKHPKTGHVDNFRNKVTYSLFKTSNQVYLPIFSQFGEIMWQRLFNIVRIIQTAALKLFSCRLFTWFWRFGYTCIKDVAGEKRSMANDTIPVRCKCACRP